MHNLAEGRFWRKKIKVLTNEGGDDGVIMARSERWRGAPTAFWLGFSSFFYSGSSPWHSYK